MWIHEGWATYLECLYVEHTFGYDDYLKYTNGYKTKIANKEPIIIQRGIARDPNQDMYFKGALFLHTLRNVVNDDAKWFKLLRDLYAEFKYKNNFTEEIVAFVSKQLGQDMTPIFDQYLRRADAAGARADVQRDDEDGVVSLECRRARFRDADSRRRSRQVADDSTDDRLEVDAVDGGKDAFKVATDLYYVNVQILGANGLNSP